MSYLAISRKYRPQNFKNIVFQEHIVKILQNSLKTKKIHHSYIFSGIRGVGKTSVARIFAKALNCERGISDEPCNECRVCRAITDGNFPDVIEIDGASNRGIDQVREIRELVKYATLEGRFKVIIIDEVHMLTNEAFNALLKTLEEPPPNTVFILATTEFNKLLPTVVSRSIHLDFRRVPEEEIVKHLKKISKLEGIEYDEWAIEKIAEMSDGSVRDSLSLLEQIASFGKGKVSSESIQEVFGFLSDDVIKGILKSIFLKDKKSIFEWVEKIYKKGADFIIFYKELYEVLREVLIRKIFGISSDKWKSVIDELFDSGVVSISDFTLTRMLNLLEKFGYMIKRSFNKRYVVELLLLELIYIQEAIHIDEALDTITTHEMSRKEEQFIDEFEKEEKELKEKSRQVNTVIEALREEFKENFKLYNSLKYIESIEFESGYCKFKFNKENSSVIKFLQPEKEKLIDALKSITKKDIKSIDFKITSGEAKKLNLYDEIENHKIVKKTLEMFKGEILEIKPLGGKE